MPVAPQWNTGGPSDNTIGNWDQATLIRFLRDFQDQQPQQFFSKLRIDQLQVDSLMNLKPTQITLLTENDFNVVGAQGAPPFQNSWVAWGAGEAVPGYWKNPFGFVHLKGVIKSGTINTVAFTLPPGYRPAEKQTIAALSNGAIGRLDIATNGDVIPVSGSNVYFSLNSIQFRTTL